MNRTKKKKEFRKNHGSAPRPMMPSRGMVVVTNDDSDEDAAYYYYGNTSSTFDDDDDDNDSNGRNESSSSSKRLDSTTSHINNHNTTDSSHHPSQVTNMTQSDSFGGVEQHQHQFNKKRRNSEMKQKQRAKPPLRLLVIGDSLAAGVGISGSSTPVLPESIAVSLSKAMHGRPVYWVCTGVPGYTSSQIVQEIYNLDENGDSTDNNTIESMSSIHNNSQQEQQQLPQTEKDLMRRLQEWQYEMKNRAQERLDESRRKASDWLEQRSNSTMPNNDLEDEVNNTDNNQSSQRNVVIRWFSRRRKEVVQKVDTIKDSMITIIRPKRSDETSILDQPKIESNRQNLQVQRHPTLHPSVVGKYDIAVVLTGLNDLKESALPFMFDKTSKETKNNTLSSSDQSCNNDHNQSQGGLVNEFIRITEALREKMNDTVKPIIDNYKSIAPSNQSSSSSSSLPSDSVASDTDTVIGSSNNSEINTINDDSRNPLVVFPALPVVPCPLTEWAPLCWFVVPLLRGIDQQKETLASLYPGLVLYVDSPNFHDIWNALNVKKDSSGKINTTDDKIKLSSDESVSQSSSSSIWNSSTGERIHLKLTDITQQTKERILDAMNKHYSTWTKKDTNDNDNDTDNINSNTKKNNTIVNEQREKPEPYELDYFGDNRNTAIATSWTSPVDAAAASSMVAIDGIHPNDDGYDIWGM
jgi:lysophospholipase L1-like esterase